MSFKFQESARYWFDNDPYFTHFMNAMSGIFPQGERYLMEALREIREQIENPALQADIRAFIGQEAMHSNEHTAFNRYADEQGIDIGALEQRMNRIYTLLKKWLPTMHNMAIGCAIEHTTATLGAELLRRDDWNRRMKGPVAELWLWHALEENEHKAVFMDAYRAAGGGYGLRAFYMASAGSILAILIAHNLLRLVQADGNLSARRLIKFLWTFAGPKGLVSARVIREFLDYYRPGFHPRDHDTRLLEQQWRDRMSLSSAA
ncbi:MAG: metal-dependent hydrolase [Stenotrophobium sp.]